MFDKRVVLLVLTRVVLRQGVALDGLLDEDIEFQATAATYAVQWQAFYVCSAPMLLTRFHAGRND